MKEITEVHETNDGVSGIDSMMHQVIESTEDKHLAEIIKDAMVESTIDDTTQSEFGTQKQTRCCGCNTVKGEREMVFDSGLKVIQVHDNKIKIDVPRRILNVCDEIQCAVDNNEFSIVCKGKWEEDGKYNIIDDYKIPKQKVEGAAVYYDLEDLDRLKMEGYNVVIHSHPFKSSSFSSSDQETINSHFECSVLYSMREFTTATIAVNPIEGVKLIVTGDPIVERSSIIPDEDLKKIEKKYISLYDNTNYGFNRESCDCDKEYDNSRVKTKSYIYDHENDVLIHRNGNPVEEFNRSSRGPRSNRSTFQQSSKKAAQMPRVFCVDDDDNKKPKCGNTKKSRK